MENHQSRPQKPLSQQLAVATKPYKKPGKMALLGFFYYAWFQQAKVFLLC
jgi:hypothetical protein